MRVSYLIRLGKVMIMDDLNTHINSKDLDFIVNKSTDNLDDFVPDNYSIDNIHTSKKKYIYATVYK